MNAAGTYVVATSVVESSVVESSVAPPLDVFHERRQSQERNQSNWTQMALLLLDVDRIHCVSSWGQHGAGAVVDLEQE